MKKSITLKLLLLFAIVFGLSSSAYSQKNFVTTTDNIVKLEIKKLVALAYISRYESDEGLKVNELKVEYCEGSYYLLAATVNAEDEKYVFITQLKQRGKKLYLQRHNTINACTGDVPSIKLFNFVDGKIKGCVNCNHKIIGIF